VTARCLVGVTNEPKASIVEHVCIHQSLDARHTSFVFSCFAVATSNTNMCIHHTRGELRPCSVTLHHASLPRWSVFLVWSTMSQSPVVAAGVMVAELAGHKGGVAGCAISHSGHIIATAGFDRSLRLWEATTHACLRTLAVVCMRCCFSPDDTQVATCGMDPTVQVWEVGTGKLLHTLKGHACAVQKVAWHGTTLASGSWDTKVRLWDTSTGLCLHTLTHHTKSVFDVSFSPDGSQVASVAMDGQLVLWSVAHATVLHCFQHAKSLFACCFSPSARFIATGSTSGEVLLWDVTCTSATPVRTFTCDNDDGEVMDCVFSSDESLLVSPAPDNSVMVWRVEDATCVTVLEGHTDTVFGVALSRDGTTVVSSSKDSTARVWDLSSVLLQECFPRTILQRPHPSIPHPNRLNRAVHELAHLGDDMRVLKHAVVAELSLLLSPPAVPPTQQLGAALAAGCGVGGGVGSGVPSQNATAAVRGTGASTGASATQSVVRALKSYLHVTQKRLAARGSGRDAGRAYRFHHPMSTESKCPTHPDAATPAPASASSSSAASHGCQPTTPCPGPGSNPPTRPTPPCPAPCTAHTPAVPGCGAGVPAPLFPSMTPASDEEHGIHRVRHWEGLVVWAFRRRAARCPKHLVSQVFRAMHVVHQRGLSAQGAAHARDRAAHAALHRQMVVDRDRALATLRQERDVATAALSLQRARMQQRHGDSPTTTTTTTTAAAEPLESGAGGSTRNGRGGTPAHARLQQRVAQLECEKRQLLARHQEELQEARAVMEYELMEMIQTEDCREQCQGERDQVIHTRLQQQYRTQAEQLARRYYADTVQTVAVATVLLLGVACSLLLHASVSWLCVCGNVWVQSTLGSAVCLGSTTLWVWDRGELSRAVRMAWKGWRHGVELALVRCVSLAGAVYGSCVDHQRWSQSKWCLLKTVVRSVQLVLLLCVCVCVFCCSCGRVCMCIPGCPWLRCQTPQRCNPSA